MLIMYTLILIATVMDVKTGRISNRLILTGWILGFLRMCVCYGIGGFKAWLFQISFPIIVLYLLFLVGALGAGDIKLFSLIGGFVNLRELATCVIAAFVIGAIWSIVWLLLKKDRCIPFAVAIFLGLLVATL